MKLKFQHPEPKEGELTGPRYWRSLDELADKPEFKQWLHREFPEGASEAEGVNRRHFLKIMSASFAAAGVGLAGCRRPESHIKPYSRQTGGDLPERAIPGIPVHYATAFPDAIDSLPLIVETHQNRPTHIEGNPDYAPYGGGTGAIVQASILDLYDADRLTSSYEGRRRLNRARVTDRLNSIGNRFNHVRGQGMAVLARPSSSPTRARLKQAFQERFPRALWAEYEPLARDTAQRAASELFERPVRPLYRMNKARRVFALDADFLHREPGSNQMARDYARGRKVRSAEEVEKMNRLYVVESMLSPTGGMADHRLRLASSALPAVAAHFVAELIEQTGGDSALARILRQRAGALDAQSDWIRECARDLATHGANSVVVAGSHLPPVVHQLALLANELLGATGSTVEYVAAPEETAASLQELAAAIGEGSIETLIVIGGNPAYDAPGDIDFTALMRSVPQVVRYGYHYDETSIEAELTIAATHYLESWSDARAYDGSWFPVQPMILPLYEHCWQENEFLALLAGSDETDPYAIVLKTYQEAFAASERDFQRLLSDGLRPDSGFAAVNRSFPLSRARDLVAQARLNAPEVSAASLEVVLLKDDKVGDGTYTNNGWLQELPDPITKMTWDNAILISPRLAESLGYDTKSGSFLIGGIARKGHDIKRGREIAPVAELTVDGLTVSGPVHIQPGLADWSVVVPLGYGRRQVGRVGQGTGFDVYPLSKADGFIRTGARLRLVPGKTARLANAQEHWSMEGRAIIRETNADYFAKNPDWVNQMGMESHSPAIYARAEHLSRAERALQNPRGGSLFETPAFGEPPPNVDAWKGEDARSKFVPEQQWGMSIDLNTCIGCNACVVACQSENNIPIVGKDQVMRGREMHWIRLDRYYSTGDPAANQVSLPSDPQVSLMPVGCMHCELAPCEQVCPVNATVHDSQGLNVMAYNRCVGTRYCANNCPYKVRRFNFFDYNKRAIDEYYLGPVGTDKSRTEAGRLQAMRANPNVTVRMRGVMEKCTYCVQRIQTAKIAQKVKAKDSNDVHIPDGVLKVACQTACPTEAIVFGDISDPQSAVSKAKDSPLDYSVLGYLNIRPRTTFLGRLRNPNPAMPDYQADALTRKEYKAKSSSGNGKGNGHHAGAHG